MNTYRILFGSMLCMILFGIAQDMVTVRVSREYFTIAHDPREVPFEDPTLMAIGWGFRACVGPGAILGIVLTLIATVGKQPPLTFKDIGPGLAVLFGFMAWTVLVSGLAGWWVARIGDVRLGGYWGEVIPPANQPGFIGVACAHLGAYASGIAGSVAAGIWAGSLRGSKARDHANVPGSSGQKSRWWMGTSPARTV